jgi:hypothetical protein
LTFIGRWKYGNYQPRKLPKELPKNPSRKSIVMSFPRRQQGDHEMPLRLKIRNFLLNLTEQELSGRNYPEQSIESTIPYFFMDDQDSPHYGKFCKDRRSGTDRRQKGR